MNAGCKCGPWPRSVARALGVQSRENWQITTGLNSDDVEPTRPIETRNNQIIFKEKEHHICRVCCNPSHHHHHHHQYENEPRAAVAAVVVQAFKYGTAPPPQPPSAPSSTDYSFLTTAGVSHKTRYCFVHIIVYHVKPQLPLIFQSPHGARAIAPNSIAVQQPLCNKQQHLFKLLPL